jgi:hypothetical protein
MSIHESADPVVRNILTDNQSQITSPENKNMMNIRKQVAMKNKYTLAQIARAIRQSKEKKINVMKRLMQLKQKKDVKNEIEQKNSKHKIENDKEKLKSLRNPRYSRNDTTPLYFQVNDIVESCYLQTHFRKVKITKIENGLITIKSLNDPKEKEIVLTQYELNSSKKRLTNFEEIEKEELKNEIVEEKQEQSSELKTSLINILLSEIKNSKNVEEILAQLYLKSKLKSIADTKKDLVQSFQSYSVNYHEKPQKRKLILFNFENDQFRPVQQPFILKNEILDITKKWYENCDILFDIEETDIEIPEEIQEYQLQNFIYKDINCQYKKEFLQNYMPQVLTNILFTQKIENFGSKFKNIKNSEYLSLENKNKKVKSLQELGIKVPQNLNGPATSNRKLEEYVCLPFDPLNDEKLHEKNMYEANRTTPPPEKILPKKEFGYFDSFNWNKPIFGMNCEKVEEKKISSAEENNEIRVIVNMSFLQTIVLINCSENEKTVLNNYPEFGFQTLFHINVNKKNVKAQMFIKDEFEDACFEDVNEINKSILKISKFIELTQEEKSAYEEEESQVKQFFRKNFTFNKNVNDKMKASHLHDLIINQSECSLKEESLAGFKNRLSKYLKDLGLEKKRYNDGFYYYGIVKKEAEFYFNDNILSSELFGNSNMNYYNLPEKLQFKSFKTLKSSE